jgi:DNA (cytosine-5)-methyltransferase 1
MKTVFDYIERSERMADANELIVDLFAGGGGASTGIEWATGMSPHIAINHDPEAVGMHRLNHPDTVHYTANIREIKPADVLQGRHISKLWMSPSCKNHAKARGSAPINEQDRTLSWVGLDWVNEGQPDVLFMENVEEIQTWGPLIAKRCKKTGRVLKLDGTVAKQGEVVPVHNQQRIQDPKRKGTIYKQFIKHLKRLGYDVETRVLCAADYGAPTSRTRWFLVARKDGLPIIWPKQTHARRGTIKQASGELPAWLPAGGIIDWSIPSYSIFLSKEEAKAQQLSCRRPLADKTMQRIMTGVQKFVIEADDPFIIPSKDVDKLRAVHCYRDFGQSIGSNLNEPVGTITASGNGKAGIVICHLVKMKGDNYGHSAHEPLQTVTAGGNHFGAVYSFLVRYHGAEKGGHSLQKPIGTITGKDEFGLVTVYVSGEPYVIVDITFRMLVPRELYRGNSFDDDYIIEYTADGKKLSVQAQVRMVGNAVPPLMAKALIAANDAPVPQEAAVA